MRALAITLCVGLVMLVGCAGKETKETKKPVSVPGAQVQEDMVTFEAMGRSAISDPDDPLARIKAETAAATMAKAGLLELIKGAEIATETTVKDLMYESSSARTQVMGWLSRAEIAFAEQTQGRLYSEDVVTATATLTLPRAALGQLEPRENTIVE